MNETDFAQLLIDGKITAPREKETFAVLAYLSLDELQSQRFDPSRIPFYLGVVENGKRLVLERREAAKQKEREIFQKRVAVYEADIWKDLKTAFGWFNPRTDKIVELDAQIEFEPVFLTGPTVTSSGTKVMEHPCLLKRSGKIEIDLKAMLDSWIKEQATNLVRENRQLKAIAIYKALLLSHSNIEIRCPLCSPLLNQSLACSTYRSGSDRVLGCSTLRLTLKEK